MNINSVVLGTRKLSACQFWLPAFDVTLYLGREALGRPGLSTGKDIRLRNDITFDL